MLQNQMPTPPTDMVMSSLYGPILVVNFAVLAIVAVWIGRESQRARSFVPFFILIGAAVASLLECAFDIMALVWYAQYGHTPYYRIFNISAPLWLLAAYPWFIGGMGFWMYKQLKQGMTVKLLWKLYFFAWAANFLLELPALQLGNMYVYYGNQPFRILGFPLWMAPTNALMPILLGTLIYACDDLLKGLRSLLVIPLVPMAVGAAQISVGWPVWLALNSGQGYGITHGAALVTLCLSLIVVYLVGAKFCQPAGATALSQHGAAFRHAAP